MNAHFLAPGSNVFYLRGTIGGHIFATVAGLLSFPECVAITYEHSGHTINNVIIAITGALRALCENAPEVSSPAQS